jgi:hypothetical protein
LDAGEALLELKLAFNATVQRLTSWRPSDPNPCGWEGISCSVPDLRVQSMCVPPRLICLLFPFLASSSSPPFHVLVTFPFLFSFSPSPFFFASVI